ncbi:urease subunit gamma [Brachybacterium sp. GCM10030268]|uniref:urease subunit gamma n=1 Tax=Brachybacterium sp. GCM10030268 TaxID=3273382 RepID=UPI003612BE48
MVARDRLERGVRLNHPETVALLSCWVIERAREGRSVEELMVEGRRVLTREQVMEDVPSLLADVQIEATFPDGRKLVTIHDPIDGAGAGDGPGALRTADGERVLNQRAEEDRLTLVFENTGDRPIQIGSHIHLPDVNSALSFDREAARGFRLDIPAGTSMRFEPGASRELDLVRLGGARRVPGIQIRQGGPRPTAGSRPQPLTGPARRQRADPPRRPLARRRCE